MRRSVALLISTAALAGCAATPPVQESSCYKQMMDQLAEMRTNNEIIIGEALLPPEDYMIAWNACSEPGDGAYGRSGVFYFGE